MNRVDTFLELAVRQGGSDLHLVAGQPPRVRSAGELQPVPFRELSHQDVEGFLQEMMPPALRQQLDERWNVDFAYVSSVAGRFRANVYRHSNGIAAVLRAIPSEPPTLESIVAVIAIAKTFFNMGHLLNGRPL